MIGRIVAEYSRRARRGNPHPFVVTHDPLTHAPSGLHRVYLHGREIGRQLSRPSPEDCERMLVPPPPSAIPPLPEKYVYTAANRARQARTRPGHGARALAHRASEPQEGDYGRLSDAVSLP